MNNKNSKIILCQDINLSRDYINVLDYTEEEMLELCLNHMIVRADNFSFIGKGKNEVQVEFSYAICLKANYLAFQNPNYSNKWFFAFIDKIDYVGDKTTKISYTIDYHSTWFSYWNPKTCLVIREHVRDDTIGKHTFPEGIEYGDYVCNDYLKIGSLSDETTNKIIIGTSWLPSNTPNLPSHQKYGGIESGIYYVAFDNTTDNAKNFILALDGLGKSNAIVTVFMAPYSLLKNNVTAFQGTLHSRKNNDDGSTTPYDYTINGYFVDSTNFATAIETDKTITMNSTINGYTPKNNKCFVAPYNTLIVTNNNGGTAEYHYEDFVNSTAIFTVQGVISPGCSIRLIPKNYKLFTDVPASDLYTGYSYGLNAGKFPMCSYQNDSFVNWMTQQAVNTKFEQINAIAKIGGMLYNSSEGWGNPASSYKSLINQQENYMNQVYQHAIAPAQVGGNLNGGDVSYSFNQTNFFVYKMSIRSEYCKMVDDYFTQYGYKINELKIPDMTSRTYFNYVQIGRNDDIGFSNSLGSVPQDAMEVINNIYRRGVTIWHNHENVGDYSVNNTIVS